MGYHHVYEYYRDWLARRPQPQDAIYWHNHPVSYFREAHKTSFGFGYTNHHLQVLSRRVIDHLDFPAAYRPGCHCERPDINLFLEQWVPFDYGNQGMRETEREALQQDISGGRYGDWRRATDQWELYHPDFYDYQRPGAMKRWMARCLNLRTRLREITPEEIEKAFARADSGLPTILAVTDHDMREIRPDIDWYMAEVRRARDRHPDVRIRHANAVDAVRLAAGLPALPPARLDLAWTGNRLDIRADKPLWGPQPYFCFKTLGQEYIHDNLDFQDGQHWSFVFDDNTVRLDQLEAIGLASNDDYGNTTVCRLTPDRDLGRTAVRILNAPRFDSEEATR